MRVRKFAVFGVVAASFLLFGCVEQLFPSEIAGATNIAKALPEVQVFLKEHPDAKIATTYLAKSTVEGLLKSIQEDCGPQFYAANYYKVTFESAEANIVAWIDLKEKIVVCSVQSKGKPTPTPTPSPTPRVVAAGVAKFSSEQEFKNYLTEATQAEVKAREVFRALPSEMFEVTQAFTPPGVIQATAPPGVRGTAPSLAVSERVSETTVQVAGIDEPDIVKTDGLNIYLSHEPFKWPQWRPQWPQWAQVVLPYRPYEPPRSATRVVRAFPPSNLSEESQINETGNLLLDREKGILVIITANEIKGYSINASGAKAELKWSLNLNELLVKGARYYNGKVYLVLKRDIDRTEPCPVPLVVKENFTITIPCVEVYHPVEPTTVDVTFHVLVVSPEDGVVSGSVSFLGSDDASILYMSKNALYVTYRKQASMVKIMASFYLEKMKDLLPPSVMEKITKVAGYDLSDAAKLLEFQTIQDQYSASLSEGERSIFTNNLQNASTQYFDEKARQLESTDIVQVRLSDLVVKATGTVPGRLLNQFSLDEHDNYLRVATTVGRWEKSFNDVYVLDEGMQKVGEVLNLGKGERIYAVRFLGDRGYVVTFREMDPFYVLDLSDPRNPALKGELKIPGYSSYLHPLAEHVILGVGMEDPGGVKASVFNVSNAAEPKEVAKFYLQESWSDVLKTHHAFLQDDKHKVFFLPGHRGGYVFSYLKDDAYVLELRTAVPVMEALRALYLGDFLYVISEEKIVALNEATWKIEKELELKPFS